MQQVAKGLKGVRIVAMIRIVFLSLAVSSAPYSLAVFSSSYKAETETAKTSFSLLSLNGHQFFVELAQTPKSREHGLMFRQFLPPNHGMLFVFPYPQKVAFWMKNTFISLDLIFINAHGKIVWIYPHAQPHSRQLISCAHLIKAVLEVNAGTADNLHLKPGDKVDHELFRSG
jgi:hypothetical protein